MNIEIIHILHNLINVKLTMNEYGQYATLRRFISNILPKFTVLLTIMTLLYIKPSLRNIIVFMLSLTFVGLSLTSFISLYYKMSVKTLIKQCIHICNKHIDAVCAKYLGLWFYKQYNLNYENSTNHFIVLSDNVTEKNSEIVKYTMYNTDLNLSSSVICDEYMEYARTGKFSKYLLFDVSTDQNMLVSYDTYVYLYNVIDLFSTMVNEYIDFATSDNVTLIEPSTKFVFTKNYKCSVTPDIYTINQNVYSGDSFDDNLQRENTNSDVENLLCLVKLFDDNPQDPQDPQDAQDAKDPQDAKDAKFNESDSSDFELINAD